MKGIIVVTALVALGLGVYTIYSSLGGAAGAGAVPTPTPASAYKPEDINHDGLINGTDRIMISQHLGCAKSQPCWTQIIGKTIAGDNPIYGSDLDLNHDGNVTQADVDADRPQS